MIRKIATILKRYADTTKRQIELEASIVLLQQQRDRLAELLVEERQAIPPTLEQLANKLRVELARFDAIPDGEPSVEELVDAITAKLRVFDEREAEAIDIGETNGFCCYSSPALVETLVDRIRIQDEELETLRGQTRGDQRLENYKLCVDAAVEDLLVLYGSKKSIRPAIRKLRDLHGRKLADFEKLETITLTQPNPAGVH